MPETCTEFIECVPPYVGAGFATKQMGGTSLTRPPSDIQCCQVKDFSPHYVATLGSSAAGEQQAMGGKH